VVTLTEMPTGDIVLNRDASLQIPARLRALESAVGGEVGALDAGRLAEAMMGDTVYANMILMGFAWQSGLVPVSLAALDRAIDLNGVAIDANRRAFALGRLAAVDPAPLADLMRPKPQEESLEKLITRRAAFLIDYQDPDYAQRYRDRLAPILALGDEELSRAAATSLFKLMAVKDEYEVARLHRDTGFAERIAREFGPGARVNYHLAPPLWPTGTDHRGRPNKRRFPGWAMRPAFAALARMKGLRGTRWDFFARHPERRMERDLLDWYEGLLTRAATEAPGALPLWREILSATMGIRGYGPVKEEAAKKVRAEVAAKLHAPREAAA
jgi:indolepyruvate ferredoxin oxidoreductase